MIVVEKLTKQFNGQVVLNGIDLEVKEGEVIAIIGPSGSGKTTFLRCLNFLEQPTSGRIKVGDIEIDTSKPINQQQSLVRRLRQHVGFVFQSFNLFPHRTALENVIEGPTVVKKMPHDAAVALGRQLLARVGLAGKEDAYPRRLSGGQQQRVAIARALTQRAEVILADEPIASLDPESARKVMEILADINRRDGKTVVVTLHQVDYAMRYCPRAVALKGGRIHFDGQGSSMSSQFLNDLYGADVDTSLMCSDQTRRAEAPPRLALARA